MSTSRLNRPATYEDIVALPRHVTGQIVDEPEIHLGRDVVVPDLAGWRKSRLPDLPSMPFFTLAPDWICEVLSPSTASLDRVKKMRVFAREGVGHAWLVDPAARTLEVYELSAGRWTLLGAHEGDEIVRATPFGEIEIPLADLWVGEASGSSQPPPPAAP